MSEEQEILEADLAGQLGLPRSLVRKVRQEALTQEEHWRLSQNGIVILSAGQPLLVSALRRAATEGRTELDDSSDPPENTPPGPPPPSEPPPGTEEAPPADPEPGAAPELESYEPDPPDEAEMTVVRIPHSNPYILLCNPVVVEKQAPPTATVRVRSNANFRRGMTLRARRLNGNLWALAGRLPRFPGRW